ncbi:MAG: hypothetical protein R2702_01660 [Acidimicrobiales bacterium]
MREAKRATVRTAAAALALWAALGATAHAQEPTPSWTFSPTTVSDGSAISASGTGCLDPDTGESTGLQAVVELTHLGYPNSAFPDGTGYLVAPTVAPDGTWRAQGAIDTREQYFGPYDDFDTTIRAACLRDGTTPIFIYEQTIVVHYEGSRAAATTTTTTPTTTALGVVGPSPSPPAPAAAQPVTGTSTYTG